MTTPQLPDEQFVSQIDPVVANTLANEFADLSIQASSAVHRQTVVACLNIHQKAKKQRLNLLLFVRRVVREQVLVWRATYGTPTQQASAMNQMVLQNREAVVSYLSPRQFAFRTSDIVDEVVNDTFAAFFKNLSRQKPVEALLSTCLIGIARLKALHQLRDERTNPNARWVPLETVFVTIDDDDIGSLSWPLTSADADEEIFVDLPVADSEPTSKRVDLARLRQWIADCFARLTAARQLLVRLRYQFWSEQELRSMSIDEVEAIYTDLGMEEIARRTGYTNAHTASVRLTETRGTLRNCLAEKMMNATK